MSTKSSFGEALERRAAIQVEHPDPFDTLTSLLLTIGSAGLPQPVSVARELVEAGLPLRKAHRALDSLASGRSHAVRVRAKNAKQTIEALSTLGVDASKIREPTVDIKTIRETMQLSQSEFAARYNFEMSSVRNWEQGRYKIDSSTRIILAIIRDCPELMDRLLTTGSLPPTDREATLPPHDRRDPVA